MFPADRANRAIPARPSRSSQHGPVTLARPAVETRVNRDEERLNYQLDRLERVLPAWLHRALKWLREPRAAWIRIPVGLLLILGGMFSILPVLGIWMLPVGLILLAQDIPFLRRPIRHLLIWTERRWIRWKLRRRSAQG